jgi:hypothetical protein
MATARITDGNWLIQFLITFRKGGNWSLVIELETFLEL